jgi:hypothetical protein
MYRKKKKYFLTQTLFCPYKGTSPYKLNQNILFPCICSEEKNK